MMKRLLLTLTAALALAACAETSRSPTEPRFTPQYGGGYWSIPTADTPEAIMDASPGWEVATRFYTTTRGLITHLHFYRAPGETGENYIKVWTPLGTQRYSTRIADSYSGPGWKTIHLAGIPFPNPPQSICIPAGTYWYVSANTNTKQARTFGYFDNGPDVSGPLVANYSFYGQPMGSFPTQGSSSLYFVGVTFIETNCQS
jgi:hypothetical protein